MNYSQCPNCHSRIPADAPGGVCPKCVLAAAVEQPRATPFNTTAHVHSSRPQSFSAPSPEAISTHFVDLEVESLIGHGGMGAVYRARQKRLDRVVALKILSPGLGGDPTFAERFAREARTLAKLSHANIVMVFEFGNVNDMCYLVMEYVDGINLRDAIRGKTITAEQALEIVPQICEALQYAHDEGVVHRDIKPENILINQRGQVKIADFGLAKLLDRDPVEYSLTGTHQVLGTRNYMAPEQIEKPESVDHRADIYSLGVVFYELLTGELPIGRFANPSEKAPISAQLDDVVLKTLEKEPSRRFQNASEIKTAVQSVDPPRTYSDGNRPQISGKPPVHHQQPLETKMAAAGMAMHSPIPKSRNHCPFYIGDVHGGFSAAYGIAKFDGDALMLEFEIRDEVFGAIKSGPTKVNIDAADIMSVRFSQGMFSGSLRVCTSGVSIASPIPNSKQGVFTLKIAKADYELARDLTQAIDTSLSNDIASPKQKPIQTPRHHKPSAEANFGTAGKAQSPIAPPLAHQANSDSFEKSPLEKVSGPAGALSVLAILNIVFNASHIVKFVSKTFRYPLDAIREMKPIADWNSQADLTDNLVGVFKYFASTAFIPFGEREGIFALGMAILMLLAAVNMKAFRNYKVCVAIMVLAMFPFYNLYFLGLIFAVWGFVVLMDPLVKDEFMRTSAVHNSTRKNAADPTQAFGGLIRSFILMLVIGFGVLVAVSALLFSLSSPDVEPVTDILSTDGRSTQIDRGFSDPATDDSTPDPPQSEESTPQNSGETVDQ